jgi:hypothetical protein
MTKDKFPECRLTPHAPALLFIRARAPLPVEHCSHFCARRRPAAAPPLFCFCPPSLSVCVFVCGSLYRFQCILAPVCKMPLQRSMPHFLERPTKRQQQRLCGSAAQHQHSTGTDLTAVFELSPSSPCIFCAAWSWTFLLACSPTP